MLGPTFILLAYGQATVSHPSHLTKGFSGAFDGQLVGAASLPLLALLGC